MPVEAAKAAPSKAKKAAVADSWEDESSGDETPAVKVKEEVKPSDLAHDTTSKNNNIEFENPYGSQHDQSSFIGRNGSSTQTKRPEKSTMAASRMIASSLGLRTKSTAEQRAFHKSQVENEKKKREAEKAKKGEEERLKQSVWDD